MSRRPTSLTLLLRSDKAAALDLLINTSRQARGNKLVMCRLLGIATSTLYRTIRELGVAGVLIEEGKAAKARWLETRTGGRRVVREHFILDLVLADTGTGPYPLPRSQATGESCVFYRLDKAAYYFRSTTLTALDAAVTVAEVCTDAEELHDLFVPDTAGSTPVVYPLVLEAAA